MNIINIVLYKNMSIYLGSDIENSKINMYEWERVNNKN